MVAISLDIKMIISCWSIWITCLNIVSIWPLTCICMEHQGRQSDRICHKPTIRNGNGSNTIKSNLCYSDFFSGRWRHYALDFITNKTTGLKRASGSKRHKCVFHAFSLCCQENRRKKCKKPGWSQAHAGVNAYIHGHASSSCRALVHDVIWLGVVMWTRICGSDSQASKLFLIKWVNERMIVHGAKRKNEFKRRRRPAWGLISVRTGSRLRGRTVTWIGSFRTRAVRPLVELFCRWNHGSVLNSDKCVDLFARKHQNLRLRWM